MKKEAPPAGAEVMLRAEGVELRREQDRIVLANPTGQRPLALNDVGAVIAERLSAPTTLATVCEHVLASFDVEPAECASRVEQFVAKLRARGLVETYYGTAAETALRRRYLDLLARALVNLIYPEHELRMEHLAEHGTTDDPVSDARLLRDIRTQRSETLAALVDTKAEGRNWRGRVTSQSHTMIGLRRLENLERCAVRVFADGVPGDFLEAGVCQGGAAIFLRALQVAYDEGDRCTWLADSFAGLPAPQHPQDVAHGMDFTEPVQPWLAASLEAVQENFRTYDLLSDRVRFLPGWFAETLPAAPVEKLAILRVDGDLYASTRDALDALYDRVSPGGYVVIDDYCAFEPCRAAVEDFRAAHGIEEELHRVDWTAVFWRRTG